MNIYAAIILGVFFLVGVFFNHYLHSERASNNSIWSFKAVINSSKFNGILFIISGISYSIFAFIAAFLSSDIPQVIGFVFLLNIVVIIISYIKRITLSEIYYRAIFIQLLIFGMMLVGKVGDIELVVAINTFIIFGFSFLSWLSDRKQVNT